MVQTRQRFRLALETTQEVAIHSQGGVEHLQGDRAAQAHLFGLEDNAHTAAGDLAQDSKARHFLSDQLAHGASRL